MKTRYVIMQVSENWSGGYIEAKYRDQAREAVEVHLGIPLTRSFEGKEVTRYDGNVVNLYAVKTEKETK